MTMTTKNAIIVNKPDSATKQIKRISRAIGWSQNMCLLLFLFKCHFCETTIEPTINLLLGPDEEKISS